MFALDDLQNLNGNKKTAEDRVQMDREAYVKGRRMYPTAPEQGLLTGFSERDRGCYMMGYNVSQYDATHHQDKSTIYMGE